METHIESKEENTSYEEAQRALRISAILTYFHRYRITVAGSLNMPLEDLEERYHFEKDMVKQRCIKITNYQDTPWYYRLIPCCVNIQRQKVIKPNTKKRCIGGSGLFGGIRKFALQKLNED